MANKKITQLTEATSLIDADIVPVVTDLATVPLTKKITWENIKAFLKSHFDTLYAELVHTHDDRYYTETESDTLLSGKSDTTHLHDDRYYTETETDSLLSGKSDTSHTHDSRYYTESEVNSLLDGKADDTNASISGTLTATNTITGYNNDNGQVTVGGAGNGSIEIGKAGRSSSGTPFIDFHSSVNSPDFDVRFLVSGGSSGSSGQGELKINSSKTYLAGTASSTNPTVTPTDIYNVFGGLSVSLGMAGSGVPLTSGAFVTFVAPYDLEFTYVTGRTSATDSSVIKLEYHNGTNWVTLASVTMSTWTVSASATATDITANTTPLRFIISTANGVEHVSLTARYRKLAVAQ